MTRITSRSSSPLRGRTASRPLNSNVICLVDELYACKEDYRKLRDRARKAQKKDQSEVCGVLLQSNDNQLQIQFLRNRSRIAGAFEISATDISDIRIEAKNEGKRVIGLFHSHPISEAIPGPRDIEEAPINSLMLIYDVCGREARLYRVAGPKKNKRVIQQELSYADI